MRTHEAMMPTRRNVPFFLPQKIRGLGLSFSSSATNIPVGYKSIGAASTLSLPAPVTPLAVAAAKPSALNPTIAPVTIRPSTASAGPQTQSVAERITTSIGTGAGGGTNVNAPYNFSQSAFGDNPNYQPSVSYGDYTNTPSPGADLTLAAKPVNWPLLLLLLLGGALIIKKA